MQSIRPYEVMIRQRCETVKIQQYPVSSFYTMNYELERILNFLGLDRAWCFQNITKLIIETEKYCTPDDLRRIFDYAFNINTANVEVYLNLPFKIEEHATEDDLWERIYLTVKQFVEAKRPITVFYYKNKTEDLIAEMFTHLTTRDPQPFVIITPI